MNAAQIRAALVAARAGKSKRELLIDLLDGDRYSDDPIRAYMPDGQIFSETFIERDIETGLQVAAQVVTHTYYPTGEIDTIVISTRDASNVEIARKTIKHYRDGSQPTVSDR